MSHAHTLIRDAAVTALTGLATSGLRVFPNRMHTMADASLPGLRVFLNDEESRNTTIHGPSTQERTVRLVVECCAKDNATLDVLCDQMQLEVEQALASGLAVGGHQLDVVLLGSRFELEAVSPDVGVKRVFFSIDFYTLASAPDSLI